MTTINFSKNGGPISITFKVENGVLAAEYYIELSEENGQTVKVFEGNNHLSQMAQFVLPGSANIQSGRLITWTVDFISTDVNSKLFEISLEFFQDNVSIGKFTEQGILKLQQSNFHKFITLK